LTPTYPLFPEIAQPYSETVLAAQDDFGFDLTRLSIPSGTTLVAIVNPNNPNDPNGGTFDMSALPPLLEKHPLARPSQAAAVSGSLAVAEQVVRNVVDLFALPMPSRSSGPLQLA
jgi:hypothetical protein